MRRVVDHLMRFGHRRFAYIGGPPDRSGAARLAELRAALRNQGPESARLAVGHAARFSIEAARAAVARLLARQAAPTAIVCATDFLALGAVDAAKASGLSCPGDVSIIGFGDTPLMDRMSPPLTTLRVDGERVGWCAADLMVRAINPAERPVHMTIEPTLVVRSSTGPLKDHA
jgi:LacI family transcriptional regulator